MNVLTSIVPDGVWVLPAEQVARLARQFPSLTFVDAPDREARRRALPDADVAFLSRMRPEEFEIAGRLRWIQSPAAGVGNLLFPGLRDSPVVVTNARGLHGESIAEHVLGVVLMLFRQFHVAVRRQISREWYKDELPLSAYRTVRGRCLGIVGLGAIGTAVAEKAAALGMRVVAVRRHPEAPHPPCVSEVFGPESLARVLEQADVLVLAAPATDENRGLIGLSELRAMKPDAILVNVARGRLVREDDLAAALAAGVIGGAALDVFEREPLDPSSPLWSLPNVIITAHTSGFRSDYWGAAVNLFAENLNRYLEGRQLINVVDKAAGY